MKLMKKMTIGIFLGMSLTSTASYAQRYNGSDVVKYALTSHGINYLLRNKAGSVNAWRVVSNLSQYSVKSGRWGNTDCSGLASAAIRFNGYRHPEASGKPSLSTALFAQAASRGRHGLRFVGSTNNMRNNVRHGDMLNRTGSPYGHVFLYNGQNSRGQIETVEAYCTRCGVGRFTKSWNDVVRTNFRIIRSDNINQDVSNRNRVFTLSDADHRDHRTNSRQTTPVNNTPQTSGDMESYVVQSGDTGARIAQRAGISFNQLQNANPGVDWRRLQIGQQLNIPSQGGGSSSTQSQSSSSGMTDYTIRRGDSLWAIAQRHGTTVAALQRANPSVNPNNLRIGTVIQIPN